MTRDDLAFYQGRRVFITGHTGFKGSWLCRVLTGAGAQVTGFALEPPTNPSLFELCGMGARMRSVIGDVRDFPALQAAFDETKPEIVFHLAAQPLVRESYRLPRYTYETNVMGTVNLLECARLCPSVKSFVNVTTDKVYRNREWLWGYREDELLDGRDPYSNSKSCSELVTHSYRDSFLSERGVAVSALRAGNVIGGGDFAADRIIPDCVRAAMAGKSVIVRNPFSVRPWQHALEPLFAYLMVAQRQYEEPDRADCYNVGPDEQDCVSTGELVELFCRTWGDGMTWKTCSDAKAPHEATFLKLDSSRIRSRFGWRPRWHIAEAVRKTCQWTRVWMAQGDVGAEMDSQIQEYLDMEAEEKRLGTSMAE